MNSVTLIKMDQTHCFTLPCLSIPGGQPADAIGHLRKILLWYCTTDFDGTLYRSILGTTANLHLLGAEILPNADTCKELCEKFNADVEDQLGSWETVIRLRVETINALERIGYAESSPQSLAGLRSCWFLYKDNDNWLEESHRRFEEYKKQKEGKSVSK